MVKENATLDIERNLGNFAYPETHTHDAGVGLSEKTIHYISDVKEDPDWVREFRLKALRTFLSKPLPTIGRARIWKRLSLTISATT
jgi:ABC-type transport system involved in Fe-S cluster assembly, permease component